MQGREGVRHPAVQYLEEGNTRRGTSKRGKCWDYGTMTVSNIQKYCTWWTKMAAIIVGKIARAGIIAAMSVFTVHVLGL
jgi:hypothetical protein